MSRFLSARPRRRTAFGAIAAAMTMVGALALGATTASADGQDAGRGDGLAAAAASTDSLQVSWSKDRAAPQPLDGATLDAADDVYVFLQSANAYTSVVFFLDQTGRTSPQQTERIVPWDFRGGNATTANPFDLGGLAPGFHNITAYGFLPDGTLVTTNASFEVPDTPQAGLKVSFDRHRRDALPLDGLELPDDGAAYVFLDTREKFVSVSFYLDDDDRSGAPRQIERIAPWDFAGGDAHTAKPFRLDGLAPGPHTIQAVGQRDNWATAVYSATFVVPDDRAFSDIGARFWQWALSAPAPVNPLADQTGEFCAVGQPGDVWFLAGQNGPPPTKRSCTIPAGVPIVVPAVNSAYFAFTNDPPDTRTEEYVRSVVECVADAAPTGTLNGARIDHLIELERSVLFDVQLPEDNYFGVGEDVVPGLLLSPSVDAGYYLVLGGLAPGHYDLRLRSPLIPGCPVTFAQDNTYEIDIVEPA